MCKTPLTSLRDQNPFFMTGVACKFDDINERRCIICLRLVRQFDIVRDRGVLCRASARKSHCKAKPLSYNRPLQKHIISKISDLTGNYTVRNFLDRLFHRGVHVIRHFCNFRKNGMADFLNSCFYSSHSFFLLLYFPPHLFS